MMSRIRNRFPRLAAVAAVLAASAWTLAPVRAADEEEAINPAAYPAPTSITVAPASALLLGPRGVQQLVVSGNYPAGAARDLSPVAVFTSSNPAVAVVDKRGTITPVADGETVVRAEYFGKSADVKVTVKDCKAVQPPSFNNEVMAVLAKAGCSMGACHGRVAGQGGFRLSLRGPFPEDDYIALSREIDGRRINRLEPERSLILQKAVGAVAHEGGVRFEKTSPEYRIITDWIITGVKPEPATAPVLEKIEVLPSYRVMIEPSWRQKLVVMGHYSDKTVRDVTHLTWFTVSDENIGEVTPEGIVKGKRRGQLAVVAHYLMEVAGARFLFVPDLPDFKFQEPAPNNFIDKYTFEKLRQMKIQPSDLAGDEEFLRRATLDLCGVLPTVEEARAFLTDPAADKRAKLVDALLERPEYADFWALKWADILRNNKDLLKEKGVHRFHRWIRRAIATNLPFDRFAAELLTASGSSFANPPANYSRASADPTIAGETVAQVFFGIRMQCAKCHNHPFERWTQNDYYNLAAFFAGVKQKKAENPDDAVIWYDATAAVTQPRSGKKMEPHYLTGDKAQVEPGADPRPAFAKWMTSPDNPFFAKATVNRLWKHLFGRGIIEPADDIRDSNPASNDELLEALAQDFVAKKFDVKAMIRTVLLSKTYQFSSRPSANNADDEVMFSHAVARQLSAEQLLDAICQVAGLPEKFPGLPAGLRAAQLPDTSLDIPFLRTFGQPKREIACECERDGNSNLSQVLQLVNGEFLHKKLTSTGGRIDKLMAAKKSDEEVVEELYLAALARRPRSPETEAAVRHISASGNRRQGLEDVLWALFNSREFLFQH